MRRVKLGQICEVVSGGTPKTNVEEYWNGEFNWITPAEINDNDYIISDTKRKITQLAIEKKKLTLLPKGTVLLSSRAPIGKVAIAGKEMYCNQGFKNLICSDEICNEYLYWYLKSKKEYLNSLGRGATFKEISKKIVENIEIKLPEIEQQRKIVNKLKEVDKIIQQRKCQSRLLDGMVQSRFVEEFGDLKINTKKWKIKTFDEMTDLITDGEHATPRRTEEGIYLLSARNIMNHTIKLEDVDYIDQAEYDRISKRIHPKEGDVLISCSGTVGRCCSVPAELKFQMVRSVALLRFKNEINPIFAEYMITSDYLKEQIDRSKTQSSQANLFQGKIKKLKGFVPPIDLQNQFAAFVQQVNKSKFVIHKFLYCFIDNKQSIIKPRLNTKESGKIRGGKPHADEF